ncbi:MAG TPA: hypothetical protein VGX78_19880 [Pirellulales bacterium]|jgi:hypothetical protein|nr:hypothetical protein [Pirellulales bacterium]
MLATYAMLLTLAIWGNTALAAQGRQPAVAHVMVYHELGRFGGWPANLGIWSWRSTPPETHRDEILTSIAKPGARRKRPAEPGRGLPGKESWPLRPAALESACWTAKQPRPAPPQPVAGAVGRAIFAF